jgi:hypothetical protein
MDQLAGDGRIVLPLALAGGVQSVVALRKEGTGLVSTNVVPGGFMPLRGPMLSRPVLHRVADWEVELADDALLAGDTLDSLLREQPRLEIAPPLGWEGLDLLAALVANVGVRRPPSQGFAIGLFDPSARGLALIESTGGSIAGPHTLLLSFGSDAVRSRLLTAVGEVRRMRLRELEVRARPTREAAAVGGDAVRRRDNFTFAFARRAAA